jgi:hypothetical protein
MEVEEVGEVVDAEDLEDKDCPAESRLARKLTNFGMAAGRNYTPRRTNSEEFGAAGNFTLELLHSGDIEFTSC